MRCLKCGNELRDDEIMCPNCGYNRNNTVQQDNQFATKNIGVYNQNPIDQQEADKKLQSEKEFDELVQIYIGPNYYNFRKGGFSWCSLFFGPFYYLYRKLYAVAIVIFIIQGIINAFFGLVTQGRFNEMIENLSTVQNPQTLLFFSKYFIYYSITFLVFYIFLGIIFKRLYFTEAVERVAKIKKENPNLGFNQLTKVVKEKGGTNILAPIIILLAPIILLIIMLIISIFILGYKLPYLN